MSKKIVLLLFTLHAASTHAIKSRVEPTVSESAIHSAAYANHHDCIREAAESALNGVNSLAWYGDNLVTALHLAAQKNNYESVQELLLLGANPRIADSLGETALYASARGGSRECLELLLSAVGTLDNDCNTKGMTLLTTAILGDSEPCVRLLLEHGAGVDQICGNGTVQTAPLMLASTIGKRAIVELLLAYGASPVLMVSGGAAVHVAAQEGHVEVLQLLLERGADANVRGKSGGTPLFSAVINGHERCIELLLSRGAQVNHQGGDVTALHLAAQVGKPRVVALLLAAGANPSALNTAGLSPAMMAHDPQCLMLLTAAEAHHLIERLHVLEDQESTEKDELSARLIFLYDLRRQANMTLDHEEAQTSSGIPSASTTQVNSLCVQCNKEGVKTCSRCKVVRYCSPECQKAHWKTHKKECKAPQKPPG